jgi:hypothetical protein
MNAYCKNCNYVEYLEALIELSEATCRSCGVKGQFHCLHSSMFGSSCNDCGKDFGGDDDEFFDDNLGV